MPTRRRPGRPPRGAELPDRDAMLDAAEAAIRHHGHGVSLETIAAQAGVTKPVLYDRVGGRADLAEGLAARLVERLIGAVTTPALTTPGWARAIVEPTVQLLRSHRELFLYVTHSHSPVVATRLTLATQSAAPLAELLVQSERTDDPITAQLWAHGVVGMLNMAVLWSLDADVTDEHLVSALCALMETGLGQ